MFGKKARVKLVGDAEKEYKKLAELAANERKKGKTNTEHQTLLKSINDKIELLKLNYESGIPLQKKFIPKKYIDEYGITNLWKINLALYWRMMYTVRANQTVTEIKIVEVLLDVLDILDHKEYNKLFGYKKK
jgi:hypothetical protein